ncbi:hypothetical protein ACFVXQ_32430, partial [Kitasatospora sp. NPDC058263]
MAIDEVLSAADGGRCPPCAEQAGTRAAAVSSSAGSTTPAVRGSDGIGPPRDWDECGRVRADGFERTGRGARPVRHATGVAADRHGGRHPPSPGPGRLHGPSPRPAQQPAQDGDALL